jgi:serine/threonine protein kinase
LDPVRKQRFEREAKTISTLNHPHICVLYDVGSQDGVDYLVMGCLEGESLAKRLEKGAMPLEQVLKYGAQIADGDSQVFKKYSQMKLVMKREALEKLNRSVNEMSVGKSPAVTESGGFGTVMEQSGPESGEMNFGNGGNVLE